MLVRLTQVVNRFPGLVVHWPKTDELVQPLLPYYGPYLGTLSSQTCVSALNIQYIAHFKKQNISSKAQIVQLQTIEYSGLGLKI